MAYPQLKDSDLTVNQGVALLTFMRDDVRNALTGTALVEEIVRVVDWCNADAAVSVLILTGNGGAFSSGGNVKEMQEKSGTFAGSPAAIQERYRRGIQQLPLALQRAEMPVIAAVNGAAIGAGLDLACMCDLRIGASTALLGETFVNLGIIPGDGGAWFLQRLIGYQQAAALTFSGRLITADEAQRLGLLLEVVEPAALLPRVQELAAEIAAKPPTAVRLTKRLMKLAQRSELGDFLETCAAFQAICHQTEDHAEAIAAFIGKRTGCYNGR